MRVASGEATPDGVGEQPGQHVFTAEEDLALVGEVPEERGAVSAPRESAICATVVSSYPFSTNRSSAAVSRRSRAFGAHLLTVTS